MSDLDHLARVLADADEEHAIDVDALALMAEHEIAYLDALGEIEDPETDGLECDR